MTKDLLAVEKNDMKQFINDIPTIGIRIQTSFIFLFWFVSVVIEYPTPLSVIQRDYIYSEHGIIPVHVSGMSSKLLNFLSVLLYLSCNKTLCFYYANVLTVPFHSSTTLCDCIPFNDTTVSNYRQSAFSRKKYSSIWC